MKNRYTTTSAAGAAGANVDSLAATFNEISTNLINAELAYSDGNYKSAYYSESKLDNFEAQANLL